MANLDAGTRRMYTALRVTEPTKLWQHALKTDLLAELLRAQEMRRTWQIKFIVDQNETIFLHAGHDLEVGPSSVWVSRAT